MDQSKKLTKLVKPLSKGQITLPIEFRRRLNIDENTILRLSLKGSKIEVLPLRPLPREEDLCVRTKRMRFRRFFKKTVSIPTPLTRFAVFSGNRRDAGSAPTSGH